MNTNTSEAIAAILQERAKQLDRFPVEQDDRYAPGELGLAAAQLLGATSEGGPAWIAHAKEKWKEDRRQRLIIAGALIIAELEYLARNGQ